LAVAVPAPAARAGDKPWTLEGAMRAVENDTEDYSKRRDELAFLKDQRAKEFIPRLGRALQGRYDVVALDILHTLASFADGRAWPYLRAYEKRSDADGADLPDKIGMALGGAKEACRPRP
jgi:hypothetical protein